MPTTPERPIEHGKEGRARRYATLDEAFQRHGTPLANQALVRRIVESADVAGFVGYRTYFKIERGSGPALEVHDGYTNGFRSEADAARLAGDAERWPSRRFQGAWGVTHPDAAPRREPTRRRASARNAPTGNAPTGNAPTGSAPPRRPSAPERPPAAVCPTCFQVLPLTGVCSTCD
ncbi:hypothetical protein [Microbacterium album]|uniref:Uncharacterized protein n=1 Tax=Microbacterium album TaxID=2053191 RepID=A0A917MNU5_9MICO|nr:hypothetical protein [Microbacterium album]GGH50695.1 hypothetical protein GCM10010921_29610 [Microbacterium album]